MPTSFTGLSEAKIDDVIVGSIMSNLPMLDSFSTQLKHPEGLVIGNSYILPVMGGLTVKTKTPGTLVESSGSLDGNNVKATEFKGAAFEAKEGEISADLIEEWWTAQVGEATKAVAQHVVDACLGLVTAANYGSGTGDVVVEPIADFDDDTLVELRSKSRKKLKTTPGAFICNPDVASKMVKLNNLVLLLGMVQGQNILTDGKLPGQALGYKAFEYIDMPENQQHLVGAIIGKNAIAAVAGAPSQLISSGDGDVRYRRIVTEPESGLSVQYTEVVQGGGLIKAEIGVVYGVKKVKNAVVRLVTE